MAERPRRRTAADLLRDQVTQLEARLAHLEELLQSVRAEAQRSTGSARQRLDRIDRVLAARIRTTRATLTASLARVSQSLAESRKSVEAELGRLTRSVRAAVKAGREAYRRGRPG